MKENQKPGSRKQKIRKKKARNQSASQEKMNYRITERKRKEINA